MKRATENKIVLVFRETRLEELRARFNTVSQARFYVQQLGGNFEDYEQEDRVYQAAVEQAHQALALVGRVQRVHRTFVPNFIFGPEDTVVALGQDGLVANTLKYLHGQPLIGVNPDPQRYDGVLLPFEVPDLDAVVPEVLRGGRPTKAVTMAKASLNNGQALYAVNDLFIGPKSHGSARYTIHYAGQPERQSSSGVIVSTGLGSTGWFSSIVAGATGVMNAFSGVAEAAQAFDEMHAERKSTPPVLPAARRNAGAWRYNEGSKQVGRSAGALRYNAGSTQPNTRGEARHSPFATSHLPFAIRHLPSPIRHSPSALPWDADELRFTVREPFPSKTTGVSVVYGSVTAEESLAIESHMPERGVIFSDGIESDFLEFNSGSRAEVTIAERKGRLVV